MSGLRLEHVAASDPHGLRVEIAGTLSCGRFICESRDARLRSHHPQPLGADAQAHLTDIELETAQDGLLLTR